MRVGILFSGGKDSTYAAFVAKKKDDIRCLITLDPVRDDSWMFHYPNVRWTSLQAQAMGIPQLTFKTEGVKEDELEDLKKAIATSKERYSIEGVYTGALASQYQKERVERICSEVGVECISPLWSIDPETHLRNIIRDGFDVIFIGVAALGLDESWLGRKLDEKSIDELVGLGKKYHLHVGLEGGEGETFVLDCPLFERRVELLSTEKLWRGDWGFLLIKEAVLTSK